MSVLYFPMWILDTVSCPIILTWRISFSVSCRAVKSVKNPLNFFLSRNVLSFPHFLKDSFAGYRILGWQPFPFVALSMSSKYLLTSMAFDVKSAVSLAEHPIYVMHWFFRPAFKVSLYLWLWDFDYAESMCGPFLSHLLQVS